MKEFHIVDTQLLKLVDYLIEKHESTQTNLEFTSYYSFGYRFYPNNKYIVEQMKGDGKKGSKKKSAPHLLLINIARYFNVDFNYFYDLGYAPEDAIRSKKEALPSSKEESVKEVFQEIDRRLELFRMENKQRRTTEQTEYYKEIEEKIHHIKEQFLVSFSLPTVSEKRKMRIEVFDHIILLGWMAIDSKRNATQLEKEQERTTKEIEALKVEVAQLKEHREKLHADLAESNRMTIEAQKGQTEALKTLLTIKSNM